MSSNTLAEPTPAAARKTVVVHGVAAVLARAVRRPRTIFVRTTVALTAISLVPDLVSGFDGATHRPLSSAEPQPNIV